MSDLRVLPRQSASPVAAVVLAVATISCCLPFGFIGALGLAGVAGVAQQYSGWFVAGSVLLLAVGFYQLYGRKQKHCRTKSGVVIFWVSAVLVLIAVLFPQVIASIAAGIS